MLFDWLHVKGDVCLLTKAFFQFTLNGRGTLMDSVQWQLSVHPHMGLNGYTVAYAACSQVVRLTHIGKRMDNLFYLLFGFGR